MADQPAEKPQPQKLTKETPTRSEWTVPTLAGLLERLSVRPSSPSKLS